MSTCSSPRGSERKLPGEDKGVEVEGFTQTEKALPGTTSHPWSWSLIFHQRLFSHLQGITCCLNGFFFCFISVLLILALLVTQSFDLMDAFFFP